MDPEFDARRLVEQRVFPAMLLEQPVELFAMLTKRPRAFLRGVYAQAYQQSDLDVPFTEDDFAVEWRSFVWDDHSVWIFRASVPEPMLPRLSKTLYFCFGGSEAMRNLYFSMEMSPFGTSYSLCGTHQKLHVSYGEYADTIDDVYGLYRKLARANFWGTSPKDFKP